MDMQITVAVTAVVTAVITAGLNYVAIRGSAKRAAESRVLEIDTTTESDEKTEFMRALVARLDSMQHEYAVMLERCASLQSLYDALLERWYLAREDHHFLRGIIYALNLKIANLTGAAIEEMPPLPSERNAKKSSPS